MNTELYKNITLDEAIAIIAEQDMLIGKLTRETINKQETIFNFKQCQQNRKKEAGYSESVSFDTVWSETLKKAQQYE